MTAVRNSADFINDPRTIFWAASQAYECKRGTDEKNLLMCRLPCVAVRSSDDSQTSSYSTNLLLPILSNSRGRTSVRMSSTYQS